MKEHVYKARRNRIISQSFFIWMTALLQVLLNILWDPQLIREHHAERVVYINIFLGLLSVPGVVLFWKYYKHSVNKLFIIKYNAVIFQDTKTGQSTELVNTDISKIMLVENYPNSKAPWTFFEYFSLHDKNGNKIIITSFFMGLGDFWTDTLSRRVSSNNIIREKKFYPLFKR